MSIYIYELYKPIYERRVEQGLNISFVHNGTCQETVFIEIEEFSNIIIDQQGVTIYQGDKKFYFDNCAFGNIDCR